MTKKELSGWVKYLSREPTYSVEAQLAGLLQTLNNANGGKMKYEDAHFTRYKMTPDINKKLDESSILAAFRGIGKT